MTPTEKAAAVVSNLIRMTQEDRLQWRRSSTKPADPNDRIRTCYEAEHQGRRLAIYEASRPHWDEYEQVSWGRYIELVSLDSNGEVGWRFPRVAGLDDLLEAVQFQATGAEELLNDLMPSSGE